MPKWLDGWTVEIAVFSITALFIALLHIAAYYDRRTVNFYDVWHRRKNDDN